MSDIRGLTGQRDGQGKPKQGATPVPVLVDANGRLITISRSMAQSPSGLVLTRATNDGTQVVTRKYGEVVTKWVEVPGITAAAGHSAGDALGIMGQFDHDVEDNPLPKIGKIVEAELIDPDDDTLVATMHIFSESFTATVDDAALAISAADSKKWVTSIPFAVSTDIGSAKVSEVTDINSRYYSPTRKLYWQFSTGGTPNIAAGLSPLVRVYIEPLDGAE